jgi:tripartite-type tricarboxylate transporter receptor subunit TctC
MLARHETAGWPYGPADKNKKGHREEAMRQRLCALAALALAAAVSAAPAAHGYPTKPVRVISASGPGGISDVFMRALGEELHKRWGQPVIIESRPGGAMNIGARACAEAEPDGYTICIMSGVPVTYNLYLFKKLPVDVENAIVPVTNLFFLTQTLAVNADLKVKSVADLVALAKAKPKTLSYSASGPSLVLYMENLNKEQGIDIVRVPFKSGGDAVNGVLSGITPITFLGFGNMLGHLRAGRFTALAIDGDHRSSLFPDVPTLAETGYTGPLTQSYFGLYAPAGVPKALLEKIAADVRDVASDARFREAHFIQRGLEPVLNTPDQFAEFLKKDRANAKRVVEETGLKPQ